MDSIVSLFKEELHVNRSMGGRRKLQGKQSGNLQVPEAIKEAGTIARATGSGERNGQAVGQYKANPNPNTTSDLCHHLSLPVPGMFFSRDTKPAIDRTKGDVSIVVQPPVVGCWELDACLLCICIESVDDAIM